MNLIKKTLLFVIAIQVLVLGQLSFVKYLDEGYFTHLLKNGFLTTYNNMPVKLPLIWEASLLHEQKEILTTSIPSQLENELKELISSQLSNNYLSLIYQHRQHQEHTGACVLVENYAKKLLGLKYVWGATGPNKFDCSGFTQKVYKTAGIKIPRNSRAQAKVGQYIKYENLQKGDMVFFDTNRKKTGRVNHVGIYLEDGKFIHASSGSKKIVITNFEKRKYYKSRFLWGRRIIKEPELHTFSNNISPNLRKTEKT
jgi:hypothetical protein